MNAQPNTSKNLIQLIHVAKSKLHMDDDVYRANLREWTGKSSTKDMTPRQLERVMDGFKKLGFKPVVKGAKAKKPLQDPVLKKLGQVWTQMAAEGFVKNGSYSALEEWAVKQSQHLNKGTAIAKLEWMSDIAVQLVEQLKRYHRRLMLEALGVQHSPDSYSDVCQRYFIFTQGTTHV